jgi:hypothetical protein
MWNATAADVEAALNAIPALAAAEEVVSVSPSSAAAQHEDGVITRSWSVTFLAATPHRPLLEMHASSTVPRGSVQVTETRLGGWIPAGCPDNPAADYSVCSTLALGLAPGLPHVARVRGVLANGSATAWVTSTADATPYGRLPVVGTQQTATAPSIVAISATAITFSGALLVTVPEAMFSVSDVRALVAAEVRAAVLHFCDSADVGGRGGGGEGQGGGGW